MIIRKKTSTLGLLFSWRGTILPKVLPSVFFFIFLSFLIIYISSLGYVGLFDVPTIGFTIFGVILSLFLSFRNTASYDRWWEGRKLWGNLIATSRHLIRDSHVLSCDEREKLLYRVMLFSHLLRDRLRKSDQEINFYRHKVDLLEFEHLSGHLNSSEYVLEHIQKDLVTLLRSKQLSDIIYQGLTNHIITLGSIQAGCDRISSTPLPFSYSVLLHRAVYSFCFLLPFIVEKSLGLWTPILVFLISYLFLGLDALSQELEEPFGVQANGLALDSIVRLIEREICSSLGHDVREALLAKSNYLS